MAGEAEPPAGDEVNRCHAGLAFLGGFRRGFGSESNDRIGAPVASDGSSAGTSDQAGRSGVQGDGASAGSGSSAAGNGGGSGAASAAGASAAATDDDTRPFFSFLVTSQAGLFGLPAGQAAPAPDPALGFGGDLGGLAGADEICTRLARAGNPGDSKVWRAFLSTAGVAGELRVDAIDRIGRGRPRVERVRWRGTRPQRLPNGRACFT
jgi:hypothetical protein